MHQAPLARTSLKLGRQTAIFGHLQACKHSPGSDPINTSMRIINVESLLSLNVSDSRSVSVEME